MYRRASVDGGCRGAMLRCTVHIRLSVPHGGPGWRLPGAFDSCSVTGRSRMCLSHSEERKSVGGRGGSAEGSPGLVSLTTAERGTDQRLVLPQGFLYGFISDTLLSPCAPPPPPSPSPAPRRIRCCGLRRCSDIRAPALPLSAGEPSSAHRTDRRHAASESAEEGCRVKAQS